ncbi:MAG: DUF1549 domain-containing protein, partial [Verrucomicrobiota bacterium]
MSRRIPVFALVLVLLGGVDALQAEDPISFNRDVKPILSDRCFKCHGPDAKNQKSDLRLDTRELATADLGGYFGIVPGELEKSEVHRRIHHTEPGEVMPPPESNLSLSAEEKRILGTWIEQGATYEKHWAFVPLPKEVAVPETTTAANGANAEWGINEVDAFVAAGFEREGMVPAKESSREKWLRRVRFDLTGLPPTLAEIDAFQSDTRTDAYEQVVDRLLATDAYAERMTVEWLDVARYSDSFGYQRDDERRVWPWRDWVLRSFRDNLG